MSFHPLDGMSATVDFGIYADRNFINRVGGHSVEVRPSEWDEWWKLFNTGTFLYQDLIRRKGLSIVVVDNSLEEDFKNDKSRQ